VSADLRCRLLAKYATSYIFSYLFFVVETLVEVPFCPLCDSEVILEVPLEPASAGKSLEFSASSKQPRTEFSGVANQSTCVSVFSVTTSDNF